MVGRVSTFFRSQTSSLDHPTDLKKGFRRPSSSRRPSAGTRSPSSSGSSISSGDKSIKMPDAHKRLSLAALHSPKTSATKIPHHQAANLNVLIESPPLVFYGASASSTGALLSGQLVLQVHEDVLLIENFKMKLVLEVTRKKPFHAHCPDCSYQANELMGWDFLHGPATFRRGEHTFPFSFLLPGHLPATMKGALSTIDYMLRAAITPKRVETIKLSQVLNVKRAIHGSDEPRTSIRIFPPTNLTAHCQLPPIIHPIGETIANLRVDGCVKRNVDLKTQHQWKLKRLMWRLDETQKTISPACSKHAAKLGNVDEAKKGMAHQDVRTIGLAELKNGWKSDYSGADGTIEIEFPFGIGSDKKPICDMKAEDGTEVTHALIVELIVAEEFAPIKRPTQITPTGAARVLRMHFNVIVTEREGLGISWDEEQPPVYENVPDSPPGYVNGDIYDVPIADYEEAIHGVPRVATPLQDLQGNGEGSSRRPTSSQGPNLARLSIDDFFLDDRT